MDVKAWRCEKIPEKEYDKNSDGLPELYPNWKEVFRKGGFVYIIYDPFKTNKTVVIKNT